MRNISSKLAIHHHSISEVLNHNINERKENNEVGLCSLHTIIARAAQSCVKSLDNKVPQF